MSDAFVSAARDQRGVLERLIKGLPGISGYADKELRRNADYRLRQLIADELEMQRANLLDAQNKLLKGSGLAHLANLDVAVTRVQTLTDKVRTASYGYAGFFDAMRIREEELDALHRFDVALLQRVAGLDTAVTALRGNLTDNTAVATNIDAVVAEADAINQIFDRRERAVVTPDLLTTAGYAPAVAAPDVAAPESRSTQGSVYDLTPVDQGSADAAAYNTVPGGDYPPAPVLTPPDAPLPPAAPVEGPVVTPDAGVYSLEPTGEPPAAPTPSGSGDVPPGFELIDDKP